ncbi:Nodulin-like [Dillenia turbinata]|uniref:Nodulin-like n=1 Tax=Dillenia turbinata TaxID=194707 RepID=A0AAN8UN15_9MAGN
MCLYTSFGADSQSFGSTVALVTCIKNFTASRGIVIGLVKGFVGLIGAILTQINHFIYGINAKSLICSFIGFLLQSPLFFLRTIRIIQVVHELKIFYNLFYISLALAGILMLIIILQNRLTFTRLDYHISASMKSFPKIHKELNHHHHHHHYNNLTPYNLRKSDSCFQNIFRPPEREENYMILQALFSINLPILFISTSCSIAYVAKSALWSLFPRTLVLGFVLLFSCWASPDCFCSAEFALLCFGNYWVLLWSSMAVDASNHIGDFWAQILRYIVKPWGIYMTRGQKAKEGFRTCEKSWRGVGLQWGSFVIEWLLLSSLRGAMTIAETETQAAKWIFKRRPGTCPAVPLNFAETETEAAKWIFERRPGVSVTGYI